VRHIVRRRITELVGRGQRPGHPASPSPPPWKPRPLQAIPSGHKPPEKSLNKSCTHTTLPGHCSPPCSPPTCPCKRSHPGTARLGADI
jgi:hypothetical protein